MIEFDLEISSRAFEPEAAYSLNKELNLAWEIIEETGSNLFLTGRAGTGKTTFLKKLRETSSKRMVVLAPTGVAAINASGATIHSFFQLPFSPYLPGKGFLSDEKKSHRINKQKKKLIASLSLLVIDEISMVKPDTLDAIDHLLRRYRNSSLPFGGLQLLLIGDLRQLPPVVTHEEWKYLKEYYATPYFFESYALKQTGYQTIELSMVYRQSDKEFIDLLNKIRDGKIDLQSLEVLNKRCLCPENKDEEGYIRLTTHNNRAAIINDSRLQSLPTREFFYEAEIDGTFPESAFPAEKSLCLKEGAQVMFVKNDVGINRKYYNGLIGKVQSLSEEKIQVRIPSGEIIDVEPADWENTRFVVDDITKEIKQEIVGTFRQYPLQLAWAITIHKSQGLTFDKAIIDAAYSFAAGQTYVALSRCRSLEGLHLETPIPQEAVIIDKEVNDFVAYCEANSPDQEKVRQLKDQYLFSLFAELFDFEPLKRYYQDFFRYALEYIVPVAAEAEDGLNTYQTKIEKDFCEVGRKFIGMWSPESLVQELSVVPSPLKERIKRGAAFFLSNLEELENFLEKFPCEIDNKTYADRFDNVFGNLLYHVRLKKKFLSSFSKVNFSMAVYLEVKAKAILEMEEAEKSGKSKKIERKNAPKKEKKPKGYSIFETLKLFKEGKNIPQIAKERALQKNTVGNHILELINRGKIKAEEVVAPDVARKVKKIIADNPQLQPYELFTKVNSILDNPIPSYMLIIYRGINISE